jgi:hypothetical protein
MKGLSTNSKKARKKKEGHFLRGKSDRETRKLAKELAKKYRKQGASYGQLLRFLDNWNAAAMWLQGMPLDEIAYGYGWSELMTADIVEHWHWKIVQAFYEYPALYGFKRMVPKISAEH